jgi:pimeloyl-ACP methyl ester carboxylesterase
VRRQLLLALVPPTLLIAGGCSAASSESADTTTSTSTTVTETTSTTIPSTTLAETTTTTVPATTTTTEDPTKPTIEVNGARLAYNCWGTGSPTVIVEQGGNFGDNTRSPTWFEWEDTLQAIAQTNKVCIYGRRGASGSDDPDKIMTTRDQVDDLVGLIAALDIEKPFVLVGHSFAGYNLRVFADQYPNELLGLVFVDATEPGIADYDNAWPWGVYGSERLHFTESGEQVKPITDLGDLPVFVLTASLHPLSPWWFDLQQVLVGLSTNSIQKKVDASHRSLHREHPQAIVDAIAWIMAQSE